MIENTTLKGTYKIESNHCDWGTCNSAEATVGLVVDHDTDGAGIWYEGYCSECAPHRVDELRNAGYEYDDEAGYWINREAERQEIIDADCAGLVWE